MRVRRGVAIAQLGQRVGGDRRQVPARPPPGSPRPTARCGRRAPARPRVAGPGSPARARGRRPRRGARRSARCRGRSTRPSSSATAVPGRGVAWISTSSAASVSPASVTEPSSWNVTAPSRAAAMTAGMAGPSRLPTFGSSGLTRRSTSSEPSAMTSIALTLTSSREQREQPGAVHRQPSPSGHGQPAPARAAGGSRAGLRRAASGPGRPRRGRGHRRARARSSRSAGQLGRSGSASGGRCRAASGRPWRRGSVHRLGQERQDRGHRPARASTSAAWSVANAAVAVGRVVATARIRSPREPQVPGRQVVDERRRWRAWRPPRRRRAGAPRRPRPSPAARDRIQRSSAGRSGDGRCRHAAGVHPASRA